MSAPRTHWIPMAAAATLVGAAAGALVFAALFGFGERGWAAIDFNAALFEDFLGPYWKTAEDIAAPRNFSAAPICGTGDFVKEPAPGYLYPAALACVLAPFTRAGPGAASWLAALTMAASTAAIISAAFVLRPPRTWASACLLGAAVFLAQPVVHAAYWGQASLPVVALVAVGFAAASRDRSALAGACLGAAGAIKLYPLLFLFAFVVRRDLRALGVALGVLLALGVALPLFALGVDDFVTFHQEVAKRLDAMARWVATPEGGRGSQDLAALSARWIGAGAAPFGRVLAFLVSLVLLVLAIPRLRAGAWLDAFALLAAVPWLVVGPTWPHALAWLPLAWWSAAGSDRALARRLGVLSFAVGSMFALRALQPPATFAWYGLPALSAALATCACALRGPSRPTP